MILVHILVNTQSPLGKQPAHWATPLIEALARGETVQTRPSGKSMEPIIPSKSLVTIAPHKDVDTTSIVLVTCADNTYLHRVGAVVQVGNVFWYRIENASGRSNGWVTLDQIRGTVERVEP